MMMMMMMMMNNQMKTVNLEVTIVLSDMDTVTNLLTPAAHACTG